jgi:hypothetical protein
VKTLPVMVELPSRAADLPEDNVDDDCFVIDVRNCEEVLGIPASDVEAVSSGLEFDTE